MSTPSSEPLIERDERQGSRRRTLRGRSPSGRPSRPPCREYLKGNCTNPSCSYWHPPECQRFKTKLGCTFGDKCALTHREVEELPSRKPKKNGERSSAAILKNTQRFGCVCQDGEPPKSSTSERVQFTEATLRHASIRVEKRSSGGENLSYRSFLSVVRTHQKFEDGSQEETERQERCARGDAWRLATRIFKLKQMEEATFFFLTYRRLVSPSAI